MAQIGKIVLAADAAIDDAEAAPHKGGTKVAKNGKATPVAKGSGGSLVGRLADIRKLLPTRGKAAKGSDADAGA